MEITLPFILLCGFIIAAILVETEGAFSRKCKSNLDCSFLPTGATRRVPSYKCQKEQCSCEMVKMADALWWKHTMTGKNCVVSGAGGPCGSDKGLDVQCEAKFKCLENICRDPANLNKAAAGHSCDTDMDCVKGLKCCANPAPGLGKSARICSAKACNEKTRVNKKAKGKGTEEAEAEAPASSTSSWAWL